MPILTRLRDRIVSDSETYRCGFCSQQFDRERLNCPACGSSEIVAD